MTNHVNIVVTDTEVDIGGYRVLLADIDADCDCTGACAQSEVIGCARAMCICRDGTAEKADTKGSVVLAAIAHAMRNGLDYIEFDGDIAELGELLSEYELQNQTINAIQQTGLWSKQGLNDIRATMSKNLLKNSKFMASGAAIKIK